MKRTEGFPDRLASPIRVQLSIMMFYPLLKNVTYGGANHQVAI